MTRRARAWWWTVLTGVLAGSYLVIAIGSPMPAVRWPALVGAVVVVARLWSASRSRRVAPVAIVVGALLPVATAWWSLVIPVTAALIIVCGLVAAHRADDRMPERDRASDVTRGPRTGRQPEAAGSARP